MLPEDESISSLHLNTARSWRGGERQTYLLVEGLHRRGHRAALVCPPDSPLAQKAKANQIPVFEIPLRGELDLPSVIQLRKLIERWNPQILQLHTAHAHTIGLLATIGKGSKPGVIVQRRVDFSIYRSGTPGLTRFKYQYGVDRYVAISRKIAAVLQNDGIAQDRIRVVHSGVPPLPAPKQTSQQLRDHHKIGEDAPLLGCIGALTGHKGHRHLIDAMPLLRKRTPAAQLVLIGQGDLDEQIKQQIAGHKLQDRVHLVGFQEDVSSWYQALDLYIHPSVEEGLGTSILDALGVGIPIIASAVGGIPEAIEDGVTGRLVPPANPTALASMIDELLDNSDQTNDMTNTGKKRVRDCFSDDAMVEGNLQVHRQLLQQE